MSIQVNDFQWEPEKNDAEYIELLESSRDEWQKIAQKAIAKLKAQEPITNTSISSAIECLLHPQDADDSDMAKAIDTAVRSMKSLKAQEPIEARLHLCESCTKEYPECDATIDGIKFGCGVGNDNIIGCTAYVNRWKAQEPRVLTLNEVEDKLDDVVWIEEPGCENLSANFAIIAAYSRKLNKVRAYFFSTSEKEFEYGEYNKTWRCWSQRPFDEQREAVGWYE